MAGVRGVVRSYITIRNCLTIIELYTIKDESYTNTIGHINLNKKLLRKRSAGNPHAAFDEAGDGNGVYRTTAPLLDPTSKHLLNINNSIFLNQLPSNSSELSKLSDICL